MGGVNHERPWIDTTQGVCDHGNYENSSFAKLDDLDDHTSMMDKIHHESQQNSGTKTCSVVGFPHISQVWVIEHCATWFLFNKVKAPKNWNAYSKPLHLKHIFQKTADLPGNLPFKSNFGGWTDETDRNAWMPWPPWISGLRTWAPKSPKRWRNWWHKIGPQTPVRYRYGVSCNKWWMFYCKWIYQDANGPSWKFLIYLRMGSL